MHVFVTGASGKLGRRVTALLLARGDTVTGLARSPESADRVSKLGATPVQGVWTELDLLRAESAKADAVIHCAYAHEEMMGGAIQKVAADDRAAIGAMVEGLKSGMTTMTEPKVFIYISGTFGTMGPDEDDPKFRDPGLPRPLSEDLTFEARTETLMTVVIRLPPIVHEVESLHPFLQEMAKAAKKHGFSGYLQADVRWPSAHYDDVAELCVLALDKAPSGKALHAVDESAISTKDLAGWVGEELGVETKEVKKEHAIGHWGFVGMLLGMDNYTTAEKTKGWTGWKPKGKKLLEEMRVRGLKDYQ